MVKNQSDPSKKMPSTLSSSSPTASSLKKTKKYKGVRMRSWGSWVSEIRAPHQKTRIWLGSYSTAEAAARAYDAALLCLKGTSADFNFPITSSSSHYIPSDTTMSPKSIQKLAAAAAKDNAVATPPAVSSPPPYSSSSSISSSPSTSDQIDDDVSLISSIGSTTTGSCCYDIESISMTDSWFNFHDDQMFNTGSSLLNPTTMVDDCYLEGDFPLWSF